MNLYVMVGDKPQGPLSLDQLRGLMRDGKVNMQTLAWMDGQGEWVPLGSIPSVVSELFPPLPNGTTPAVEPRTTPSSQPPAPDPVASSSTPANGVAASSMEGGEMFALVALLVLVAVYLLAGHGRITKWVCSSELQLPCSPRGLHANRASGTASWALGSPNWRSRAFTILASTLTRCR